MAKPTLSYYLVARKNPPGVEPSQQAKYYAQKVRYTNIGNEELLNRILENTSVPRGVIRAAIEAITDSIVNFVLNGHSVELGGLMSLRTTIQSRLQDGTQGGPPSRLADSTKLRIRAYWGNDIRKFQSPDFYNFEKVQKMTFS